MNEPTLNAQEVFEQLSCEARLAKAQALKPAFRQLVNAVYRLWGNPEECDDCVDIDERPCAVHASQPLFYAMLAAEEALGPCRCGHPRSKHHDEDSTACRECSCEQFNLREDQR